MARHREPDQHGHVQALTVGSRWTHRGVRLSEWVRDRFWFIPVLLVLGGILTAVVVAHPEVVGLPRDWGLGSAVRTSTADTMLEVMSSSMLTFVGVVFAITLVGLQLASSQLSPRVIRTFVRSGVTKVAFGFFLATFAFAVSGLAMDEVVDPSAAARTVVVSMAMLAGAVVVFVIYVTATMRLLEVGWVITAVANEARAAIRRGYPPAEAYVDTDPPVLVAHPHVVHLSSRDTRSYKGVLGTVLGVDRPRLVRLATKYDCVIEILPRVGEYVVTGGPVMAVHGSRSPPDADLLTCIDLGRARTLYQDPTFGIRQLVDVATQALSPAINQPTTAVLVIDRLHDLLLRIARLPSPTGLHVDPTGTVRLVECTYSWGYLVHLAFVEITALGISSPHVTRRLGAALQDLQADVASEAAAEMAHVQATLDELLRGHSTVGFAGLASTPDRLGLG
jgi:uncharacterized membrane protein